jgi:hypothetical protein
VTKSVKKVVWTFYHFVGHTYRVKVSKNIAKPDILLKFRLSLVLERIVVDNLINLTLVLHSAIEAFFKPLWSLEKHVAGLVLILLKIIPLIAVWVVASQEVERSVPLSVVVVEPQHRTLLLLVLRG